MPLCVVLVCLNQSSHPTKLTPIIIAIIVIMAIVAIIVMIVMIAMIIRIIIIMRIAVKSLAESCEGTGKGIFTIQWRGAVFSVGQQLQRGYALSLKPQTPKHLNP